jgi:phosphoribosyl 1,2-cyclic phosphate phosphodiesterase
VLYTHAHSDHILGLDDLRPFNFVSKSEIPVYADEASGKHLHRMFGYAFEYDEHYQGGAPPRLVLKTLQPYSAVNLFGVDFLPLPIMHGKNQILGFRIGDFAYMTDCSEIPAKTLKHLDGLRYLIIDGLRNRVHRTHFTHEQAVRYIEQIKPAKAFLTHISHEIDHNEGNKRLKDLTALDVELAYDGLSFEF